MGEGGKNERRDAAKRNKTMARRQPDRIPRRIQPTTKKVGGARGIKNRACAFSAMSSEPPHSTATPAPAAPAAASDLM